MDSPRVLHQTDCDKADPKPVTVDSGKPIRPKDFDAVIERSAEIKKAAPEYLLNSPYRRLNHRFNFVDLMHARSLKTI